MAISLSGRPSASPRDTPPNACNKALVLSRGACELEPGARGLRLPLPPRGAEQAMERAATPLSRNFPV